MNAIAKKCYCGKMNETSDPLSISSIDTNPFDVYSYLPGKLRIFEIGILAHIFGMYMIK